MKSLTKLALIGLMAGMAFGAQALSITPTSGVLNTSRWTGNENSTPELLAAVGAITGGLPELWKQNTGGAEEGSLASSYQTGAFAPNNADASGVTISYTGGNVLTGQSYLLVKDGANSPAWYLFDLTALGWNGTDNLDLSGFWAGVNGSISHVSLFGTAGAGSVPDAGTSLALLGLALGGLSLVRRKVA